MVFERERQKQLLKYQFCIKEVMAMDGMTEEFLIFLQEKLDRIESDLLEVWTA